MSRFPDRAELDARVEALARRQHGVVSRPQLLERGATSTWVDGRVRSGRLRPLHRGVYRLGPLRTQYTRPMAALLAAGPEAAIGYRTAAALWGFHPPEPSAAPVHVLVPGSDRGRRSGIHPHRVPALPDDEVTEFHGMRLTTPSRTLVDLASAATRRELRRALARAERLELLERADLLRVVERHPTRPGVGMLRLLLEEGAEAEFTRSRAEERLLELVRRARLPRPEVNVPFQGFEVDFLWRRSRLVVEVDGFAFHSSRRAFERDRARDGELTALGFRVLRVTWRQLDDEPEAVVARLARALGQDSNSTRERRRPAR